MADPELTAERIRELRDGDAMMGHEGAALIRMLIRRVELLELHVQKLQGAAADEAGE